MKKIILIMTIVALMTAVCSFAAMARGRGMAGVFWNNLNLTSQQQQKVLAIRQDFQKDTLALRFDFQKKKLELRRLWAAQPLNQAAIDAKTKEVTALKVQMTTKNRTMREKLKGVLTAKQLKMLDDSNRHKFSPGFGRAGRRGDRQGRVLNNNKVY
jgi:Spy/CpxP family protein refolding chaperone